MTEQMMNAENFWSKAADRVMQVAFDNNLDAAYDYACEEEILDPIEFLFDLFDHGDYEPTDEEIVAALTEALEELN